ncbi:hypothetical protein ACWESE_36085, partial [Streptomyces xanthochromogenes]
MKTGRCAGARLLVLIVPYGLTWRIAMPELFIAGRWTAAAEGHKRDIRCPADGTLVAQVLGRTGHGPGVGAPRTAGAGHPGPHRSTRSPA